MYTFLHAGIQLIKNELQADPVNVYDLIEKKILVQGPGLSGQIDGQSDNDFTFDGIKYTPYQQWFLDLIIPDKNDPPG